MSNGNDNRAHAVLEEQQPPNRKRQKMSTPFTMIENERQQFQLHQRSLELCTNQLKDEFSKCATWMKSLGEDVGGCNSEWSDKVLQQLQDIIPNFNRHTTELLEKNERHRKMKAMVCHRCGKTKDSNKVAGGGDPFFECGCCSDEQFANKQCSGLRICSDCIATQPPDNGGDDDDETEIPRICSICKALDCSPFRDISYDPWILRRIALQPLCLSYMRFATASDSCKNCEPNAVGSFVCYDCCNNYGFAAKMRSCPFCFHKILMSRDALNTIDCRFRNRHRRNHGKSFDGLDEDDLENIIRYCSPVDMFQFGRTCTDNYRLADSIAEKIVEKGDFVLKESSADEKLVARRLALFLSPTRWCEKLHKLLESTYTEYGFRFLEDFPGALNYLQCDRAKKIRFSKARGEKIIDRDFERAHFRNPEDETDPIFDLCDPNGSDEWVFEGDIIKAKRDIARHYRVNIVTRSLILEGYNEEVFIFGKIKYELKGNITDTHIGLVKAGSLAQSLNQLGNNDWLFRRRLRRSHLVDPDEDPVEEAGTVFDDAMYGTLYMGIKYEHPKKQISIVSYLCSYDSHSPDYIPRNRKRRVITSDNMAVQISLPLSVVSFAAIIEGRISGIMFRYSSEKEFEKFRAKAINKANGGASETEYESSEDSNDDADSNSSDESNVSDDSNVSDSSNSRADSSSSDGLYDYS